jgi:hypothetical protein
MNAYFRQRVSRKNRLLAVLLGSALNRMPTQAFVSRLASDTSRARLVENRIEVLKVF